MQTPYAGITRSGSVGRRTRAVVRTPPSQPTMWCELPKVSFASLTLAPERKVGSATEWRIVPRVCGTILPVIWSALERQPAARPGVEATVEVDRLTTLGIEELGYAG